MTWDEYQAWCAGNLGPLNPEFCSGLGIAGEAGECADLVKKERCHGVPREQIAPKMLIELGDTLWYLAVLAHQYGFSLDDVREANIAKLRKRFADDGKFTTAESIARVDDAPSRGLGQCFAVRSDPDWRSR